ncbi:MAG: multiple antibiotic resistance protein [Halioglobus sp.]|jgi:multiple antibiotic resistance protein
MDHPVVHFGAVFMAFFAIMNPIVNAPVFLGVTETEDASTLRGIALRAVLMAFLIVATFTLLGRQIFDVFGITLPAFRIAGGILVGLVGYHMLQGRENVVHTPSVEDNANSRDAALSLAISPLAIPVLAGPGTIATSMNFSAGANVADIVQILAALAAVCLLNFLAFDSARSMVHWLGQNVIKVVSRLMGLILAVMGVQMLIDGIRAAAVG